MREQLHIVCTDHYHTRIEQVTSPTATEPAVGPFMVRRSLMR